MAHHSKEEIQVAHSALLQLVRLASITDPSIKKKQAALECSRAIRKIFPDVPIDTLDDVPWNVDELLFAEVENIRTGELGILLAYDVRLDGERFIYVNHFDDKISRYSPEMLTLTGEKYNLKKETPND